MDKYGLYVHIPFCVKKCLYCDFVSGAYGLDIQNKYIEKLKKEIEDKLSLKTINVDTIFIGGGTPSIVEAHKIGEILDTIRKNCNVDLDAEITIECNPGTVNRAKLKCYKEFGVNRISFGLQSTDNDELKSLGRIHTYEDFLTSYDLARKVGFDNVNIDLISSIPNQTVEGFNKTLKLVKNLKPEHISSYSLIVEEGTPFYNMDLNLPSEDDERIMVEMTGELLGPEYKQYEISNYSIPGKECRHNIKYWKRNNYLGFGVAAASLEGNVRTKNTLDINEYLDKDIIQLSEYEKLSLNDEMSEYIFLGLRMNEGIDINEFKRLFNKDIYDIFNSAIIKHLKEGLLDINNFHLFLTDKGRDLCNYVCADFLL